MSKLNKVNFQNKSSSELLEVYKRQIKILGSRRFIERLPDKGEKLNQFIAQLDIELNKRDVHKKLCTDMLALNISSDQLDTFEWTGKHVTAVHKNSQPDVIGDDEVLKMFASHSGVNQDKIIIENKVMETMDRYAKNLCGRFDSHVPLKKKHFLLNKPAVPNKHTIVKSADVSLTESIMLQITYNSKFKNSFEMETKEGALLKFTPDVDIMTALLQHEKRADQTDKAGKKNGQDPDSSDEPSVGSGVEELTSEEEEDAEDVPLVSVARRRVPIT